MNIYRGVQEPDYHDRIIVPRMRSVEEKTLEQRSSFTRYFVDVHYTQSGD